MTLLRTFFKLPDNPAVRSPVLFLMALAFINWFGFAAWQALLNNFVVERAGFEWAEIGMVQSLREVPGFLAFTAIFWFALFREQTVAYVSLLLMAIGVTMTGYFPTLGGVLVTTFIMSLGFHYFETVNQSLQLQLLPRNEAPRWMGTITSAGAVGQFLAYGSIAAIGAAGLLNYKVLYAMIGVIAAILTVIAIFGFGRYQGPVPQNKTIVLRSRYWLYYAMTFMSGARRQLFHAFAGFLLVKKFGFSLTETALMMLVTAACTALVAGRLGALVAHWGERRTIQFENVVLICVFAGYAVTTSATVAAMLFVIDGVFFTLSIAQRSYFQKIGDAADMAPTAAVAFTINHIAAVFIPVFFGRLGMINPSIIFWLGVVIATLSLVLGFLVPRDPSEGNETTLTGPRVAPAE